MRKRLCIIISLVTNYGILSFFQFGVRVVCNILIVMARHNLQNPVPTSAAEIAGISTVARMCS